MNQNNEPNRCLKCQKEIEPQYYYCEKCADKRMKWQLALTIFLSAVVLFVFSAVYNLLKPSVNELIYKSFSSSGTEGAMLGGVVSGAYTLIHYAIAFGIIRFIWNKFKYADSELRDVPNAKKTVVTRKAETKKMIYVVGEDIPVGKHSFVATNAEGGLIRLLSYDNTLLDRIYIKKRKKINLKSGTIVNAFNCYAESYSYGDNNTPVSSKIRFCRKCGEKLIDNSIFCRKCGTEIVNVEED